MRILILTCLLFSAGCASTGGKRLYTITPVVTMTDSIKCATDGGNAGLIADLGPDGVPINQWVAGCVLLVK